MNTLVSLSLRVVLCVFTSVFITSCMTDPEPYSMGKQMGYRPLYASFEEMRNVQMRSAQALVQPGKIYIKGHFLFVNDINKGIHVFNNRNPALPIPISFISIPGNVDIAVKDNILYADNATDLVALDISNPTDIKLVNRIENTFPYSNFPPFSNVDFECVDPAKGIVVGWEETLLENADCFR